jgi:iron(III) transport system permease protein
MSRPLSIFVLIVSGLYFALFLVWPVVETLRGAFFTSEGVFTFAYLAEVFRNPIYLEGLINAFLLAVASDPRDILALPLAFLSDRFSFPGKSILSGLLLVPMILPALCRRYWREADPLGQRGAFNVLETIGSHEPR